MLIPWPHYVSRKKGRGPVLCITFSGGFKGWLWFADVTLHSIWRESFPGAVRQGPSFALLSSLLGAASGRGRCREKTPTGRIRTWPRSGVETLENTQCLHAVILAYLNTKTRWHPVLWLQPLELWQAFKVTIVPPSFHFVCFSVDHNTVSNPPSLPKTAARKCL